MKEFIAKLNRIQVELNAPKSQFNKFGKYNYRNCEDILEALKPLLKREGLIVTVTDDIHVVGDRVYVKATATITDGENSHSTTAHAREAAEKKGMDDSQLTGATSSYARKYALNGLFLIDDNKDADSRDNMGDNHDQQQARYRRPEPQQQKQEPVINPQQMQSIQGAMKVSGVTDSQICTKFGLKQLGMLPSAQFETLMVMLEKKATQNQTKNQNAA